MVIFLLFKLICSFELVGKKEGCSSEACSSKVVIKNDFAALYLPSNFTFLNSECKPSAGISDPQHKKDLHQNPTS